MAGPNSNERQRCHWLIPAWDAAKWSRLAVLCIAVVACGTGKADDHDEHGHDEHGHDEHGHGDHDEHGDGDHDDEHEDHVIVSTSWSETLELFTQRPELSGHDGLEVTARITVLDGFRPYRGSVRYESSCTSPRSGAAHRAAAGVYRIDLSAAPSRDCRVTWHTEAGDIEGLIESEAHHGHDDHGEHISLLKEQQWNVRFGTELVRRVELRPSVEVSGELTTPPSGMAHVHAPVSGRVLASRGRLPQPGDEVRRGQLLALLAPTPSAPEEAARTDLAIVDAQARVDAAQLELERATALLEQRAVPERRVRDARRALQVAQAALTASRRSAALYRSAKSGTGGGGWRITAPIAGVVDEVRFSPGEAVDSEELLIRIINPDTLWVRADVPESWAARLRRAGDASFQLIGDDQWRPIRLEEEPNASLISVGRSVEPHTRTVRVVYELLDPDDDALRVGASLRVAVPVGDVETQLAVPRSAVLDVQGRSMVVVQVGGEDFEEREVRLGSRDGDRVGVVSGLHEEDRIVTVGANYVHLAGQANETIGHGHVH